VKVKVKALYDFAPQHPAHMRLRAGQVFTLRGRPSPQWWSGTFCDAFGTVSGLFPASYVQVIPTDTPTTDAATPVTATLTSTPASSQSASSANVNRM
jgi:Variant SH3 domain